MYVHISVISIGLICAVGVSLFKMSVIRSASRLRDYAMTKIPPLHQTPLVKPPSHHHETVDGPCLSCAWSCRLSLSDDGIGAVT